MKFLMAILLGEKQHSTNTTSKYSLENGNSFANYPSFWANFINFYNPKTCIKGMLGEIPDKTTTTWGFPRLL